MDFLKELNEIQHAAVTTVHGPSLVIAGAGSGKTRVLTFRIAYLLNNKVNAGSILALTFTNKAAKEMKERIAKLVGFEKAKYLWMGTFHSIFAKILRSEAALIGFPSDFTIYDTTDCKSLIKSILKDMKLSLDVYKEGDVLHRISTAKNNLLSPEAYGNSEYAQADLQNKKPEIARIYKTYVNRCKQSGAMDFDDLLLKTNQLLDVDKEVLEKYQNRFQYILVDEYQDTNSVQYEIIRKLAMKYKNITVVGDDSQSIYSFRGAKIQNILNFQKNYPDYKLFKLEQNYRSTQNIVNAANSVIDKNQNKIPKVVFSKNDIGEKITLYQCETDNEEGVNIANAIVESRLRENYQFKDFAILYRTNAQSRIFEESLRRRSIPYKIYGGLSFYSRKEIKDVISYFRLTVNKKDNEALKRIINYPKRGIGDTTFEKIERYANANNFSLWDLLCNLSAYNLGISKGTLQAIQLFVRQIEEYTEKLQTADAFQLAYQIASTSGILKDLYADKSVEGISRHENVEGLLNGIKEFSLQKDIAPEELTLSHFLQDVALLTNEDNEKDEDKNKVVLMTIHSAKGLEFKHVFLVGVEEGLFPNQQATFSQHELEEERRLFYVALTRAEKHLTISFSKMRFKWGQLTFSQPSRFIRDIDARFIVPMHHFQREYNNRENDENSFENQFTKRKFDAKILSKEIEENPMKAKTFKGKEFDPMPANKKLVRMENTDKVEPPESKFEGDDLSRLKEGSQVEHQRFGYGKVTAIEGEFPNVKATITFQKSGEKQLLLKFAKLKIIR